MATKAELELKITKAKANKMMPEALKNKYIEKIEKEISELKPEKKVKSKTIPEKDTREKEAINKTKPKFKKGDVVKEFEGSRLEYIVVSSEFDNEYKQFMYHLISELNKDKFGVEQNIYLPESNLIKVSKKSAVKKDRSKEMEKAFGKEFMESKDKGSRKIYAEDECDELIEKERARKKSAKKSAQKSPAKKSEAAIEKVADAIETKYKAGDLSKEQILKMIKKLRKEIKHLENLLKTAK